jgi:hypothetical protein
MPKSGLLLTCGQCGLRWNDGDYGTSIIQIGNATDMTFGEIATNCPRCGGRAKAIGGTYDIRDGQWHLVRQLANDLRSAHATQDDYARLLQLLRQAHATGQGAEQVAEAIKVETPFIKLSETIRGNLGTIGWVVAVLLQLITWLVPPPDAAWMRPSGAGDTSRPAITLEHMSSQQLDQLAKDIARQLNSDNAPVTRSPNAVGRVKGSDRNLPCPCGSGKKAKKCCDSLSAARTH